MSKKPKQARFTYITDYFSFSNRGLSNRGEMTWGWTHDLLPANPDTVKGGQSFILICASLFEHHFVYLLSAGFDVGRGTGSFDEEGRHFIVSSISTKIWHVKEYTYQLLPEEEYGHFYSSEGLSLLLWKYVMRSSNVTIVCVELNGGRKSGIWKLKQPQKGA